MSSSSIKILAILTMLLDHIGFIFFPQFVALRAIGRLSFILFAFLIANGAIRTHNLRNYTVRILLFAFISQIPYLLMLRIYLPDFWGLNVLFTFCLALICINFLKSKRLFIIKLSLIICILFLADFLHTDYGALGVVSVILFYVFFNKRLLLLTSQILIFGILFPLSSYLENSREFINTYNLALYQPVAILALSFVFAYNKTRGFGQKYFFYLFYPIHMLCIWGLYVLIDI